MHKFRSRPVFQLFTSINHHSTAAAAAVRTLTSSTSGNQLLDIINNESPPFEPKLTELAPSLTRDVVVSALHSKARKHPGICFRLFIWSAGIPRFRSGQAQDLIVDMLITGAKAGYFDLYWNLLDEFTTKNVPFSADAFAVLILGYFRLNKADKAVDTFGKMRAYGCEPNLAVYNIILNVVVKKNTILLALAIFNLMFKSSFQMSCDSYNILIDGLWKNDMSRDALKLFDEMIVNGIWPNVVTYTAMVSGLCRAQRVDDAFRLFTEMKNSGCKPDAAIYNSLLHGFSRFGQIDEAVKHTLSFTKDGYNIGIKGFTCLIDGLIRAKRISEAEEWFHKMFQMGLLPDVVLYSVMMRGLVELGRRDDAVSMLRDMITRGITPDTQCYNVLIRGFCEAGLLDEGRSLQLEISSHGLLPDTFTYTILICGMCRNGLLREAQQIFDDMEKHGCSPSLVTFNTLIDALCKAGKIEEAHLTLYKMEMGKNPSVFLRLYQGEDHILDSANLRKTVESMVEAGFFLKAYKLLRQLDDNGVLADIRTYNILINGLCKVGRINGAYKLVEELQLKGHVPDSVTYATLIQGLQRLNRGNEAVKLFEKMNENGCKPGPSVYKTLMTWSCSRGQIDQACRFWLEYLSSIYGMESACLKLVAACFEKGEFENGFKRLLELEVKLTVFDSSPYNILLVGLCLANRVEEMMRTFSLLKEFCVSVSAPSCVKLIAALFSKGYPIEAAEVFKYFLKRGYKPKVHNCQYLLRVLHRSNDTKALATELSREIKSSGYGHNFYKLYRKRPKDGKPDHKSPMVGKPNRKHPKDGKVDHELPKDRKFKPGHKLPMEAKHWK